MQAVKNPAVQKAAKKVVQNPAVQKAVVAEAVKVVSATPAPAPASEPPGWVTNSKTANATAADVETGDSLSTANSQGIADFPIEEETLKLMQRWHLAVRAAYMVAAIVMGVLAGLSLNGQQNIGLIFFAFYVLFFSLLIFCFEAALSVSSKFLSIFLSPRLMKLTNFIFAYSLYQG